MNILNATNAKSMSPIALDIESTNMDGGKGVCFGFLLASMISLVLVDLLVIEKARLR